MQDVIATSCKREYERAELRLHEEDMEWKPLYINNMLSNSIMGYYTFLFKKQADGSISGYKWTVVYQAEEFECGLIKNPVTIEAYNLYFKEYKNVAGVLGYREPGHTNWQCYLKSTIRDRVHSYSLDFFLLEYEKKIKEGKELIKNNF